MINFDAVDFSERRSEEVISFFWRSVYIYHIFLVFSRKPVYFQGIFSEQYFENTYIFLYIFI